MGRNKEVDRINRQSREEYDRLGRQYEDYNKTRSGSLGGAQDRSNMVFNKAYQGYGDFLDNYGPGSAPSGGGSATKYFKDFANTGGVDLSDPALMGWGNFQEFAKTGGVSDENARDIRLRGAKTGASLFDALRTRMSDQANISGAGPAYTASLQAMARDQSRNIADTGLNTELELMDRINKGRMWGAGSGADARRAMAEIEQRGKMFGAEGLSNEDDRSARYEMMNRGLGLEALGGLAGLRGQTPGEVSMYESLLGRSMEGEAGARGSNLGMRMQYNPNRSFGERVLPWVNAGLGLASAFIPRAGLGAAGGEESSLSRFGSPGAGQTSTRGYISNLPYQPEMPSYRWYGG